MKINGSISIFTSCILMILVIFCATIIDATRIHIAKIQTSRAFYIANQSVLANYDSQLAKQYGIFALDLSNDEIENKLSFYLESSLKPDENNYDSSLLLQFFKPSQDSFYKLYNYEEPIISIDNKKNIINPDYIKLQILEYMKFRAPLLALEPFLKKLELVEKASKTTEVIIQKNEVVEKIDEIQKQYYKLEKLIDGLMFETKDGEMSYDKNGLPKLYNNYVKKIFTKDSYTLPIYSEKEIPDLLCLEKLNKNVLFIDNVMKNYENAINQCKDIIANIAKLINEEKNALKSKESIKDSIRRIKNKSELDDEDYIRLKKLYNKLDDINDEIDELKDKINDNGESFNKYYEDIYNSYVEELTNLTQSVYSEEYGYYGLLGIHNEALKIIDEMKKEISVVEKDINDFKEVLKNKDNLYIDETCENLNKEMENYEKILGLNENNEQVINNLNVIEKVLIDNKAVLESIQKEVNFIQNSEKDLSTYWLKKGTNNDENLIKDIVKRKKGILSKLLKIKYNSNLDTNDINNQVITNTLNEIETKLDKYSREIYFDYSMMNERTKEDFDYEKYKKSNENNFEQITTSSVSEINFEEESIPSEDYFTKQEDDNISKEDDMSELKMNTDTSNKLLKKLTNVSEGLADLGTNLRDDIYINEYIVGMFRMATEVNNKSNDDKPLTLNNYPKSEHKLNYEVEYILFGNKEEAKNLMAAISIIFAMRVALNIIHIISNADKMNKISTAANAIAGWWTLGIGSIIISVVLTLIWATVESVFDLKELLKGEEVPLIKTTDTWETDIMGGIIDIADDVVDDAIEDKTKGNSISNYIPSLDYKDYLRILLFSGVVNEEKKLIRILDLIQLNMSKERNEDIFLKDYISSFSSSLEIEVNYMFFTLPFMSDRTNKFGNVYTINCNESVTY